MLWPPRHGVCHDSVGRRSSAAFHLATTHLVLDNLLGATAALTSAPRASAPPTRRLCARLIGGDRHTTALRGDVLHASTTRVPALAISSRAPTRWSRALAQRARATRRHVAEPADDRVLPAKLALRHAR